MVAQKKEGEIDLQSTINSGCQEVRPANVKASPCGESLGLSRIGRDLPQDVLLWVFLF